MNRNPSIRRLLPTLILLAAVVAPSAALALSRTVHVRWRVTNTHPEDVLVYVTGAYMHYPENGEIPIETIDFGAGLGFDNEGIEFGPDPVAFYLPPGQSRMMDLPVRITTGHTWHYKAMLFSLPQPGVQPRALAEHEWKAKVNLTGVEKCSMITRIDPEQRLLWSHVRDDEPTAEDIAADLALTLVPGYDVITALIANDPYAFLEAAAFELLYASLDFFVPGLGNATALLISEIESLIKSNPGTCFTQIVVRPPVEAHRRNVPNVPMRGSFGATTYSWTADFNGDGYPDVATADNHRLLIGASRGQDFWREQSFSLTPAEWGGGFNRVGDFDGDGIDDLAAPYYGNVYIR
ncbi:MAG: VCBS repeat-containing protein, partial [Myxococcales bacterium]|nr:VCBS repeat-containing protein [Myxococcales bacterium]